MISVSYAVAYIFTIFSYLSYLLVNFFLYGALAKNNLFVSVAMLQIDNKVIYLSIFYAHPLRSCVPAHAKVFQEQWQARVESCDR